MFGALETFKQSQMGQWSVVSCQWPESEVKNPNKANLGRCGSRQMRQTNPISAFLSWKRGWRRETKPIGPALGAGQLRVVCCEWLEEQKTKQSQLVPDLFQIRDSG
jgi:phage-related protein